MSDYQNNPYGEENNQSFTGTADNYTQSTGASDENKGKKGFAIWSFVIGLAMLLIGCCLIYAAILSGSAILILIPALVAAIGLVLGIMSLVNKQGGKGLAIAGVIICALTILGNVYMFFSLETANNRLMDKYGMTFQEVITEYSSGELSYEEYMDMMNNL